MALAQHRSQEAGEPPNKPTVDRLENGDSLTASEFLHRYEGMPQVKKAELIESLN